MRKDPLDESRKKTRKNPLAYEPRKDSVFVS